MRECQLCGMTEFEAAENQTPLREVPDPSAHDVTHVLCGACAETTANPKVRAAVVSAAVDGVEVAHIADPPPAPKPRKAKVVK